MTAFSPRNVPIAVYALHDLPNGIINGANHLEPPTSHPTAILVDAIIAEITNDIDDLRRSLERRPRELSGRQLDQRDRSIYLRWCESTIQLADLQYVRARSARDMFFGLPFNVSVLISDPDPDAYRVV